MDERAAALAAIAAEVGECRRCPRLVAWREEVARLKTARFAAWDYWARPVPGFGDPAARVLIVGLAPAAHGGNRTGRVFTGDRSGDFLFTALWATGFANQPTSVDADDGLRLQDVYITAVVKSAPPDNRPTPDERDNCLPYLVRELELLTDIRVVVALGGFAWDGFLRAAGRRLVEVPRPRPRFRHGAEVRVGPWTLVGTYHPSQQNTFTGRLTPAMLEAIFRRARSLAAGEG